MLLSYIVAETSSDFYVRREGDFQSSFSKIVKLSISYDVKSVLYT